METTKNKRAYKSKLSLKIIIPFAVAAILIASIAVVILRTSTARLSDAMMSVKLVNSMEMYTDYQLATTDESGAVWVEYEPDVFYWDWESDEYSQAFLHASDFGFVSMEYNSATGCYEVLTDLDSGVNRILAYDASVLEYENCQQLNKDGQFYYESTEMKDGILNKYYWLIVAQSEDNIREGYARRAYAVVYNVTESMVTIRQFYIKNLLLMLIPALIFVVILGNVIIRMVNRIRYASEYVAKIGADNLPEEPLVIKSHDELGEMAESVNLMVNGLKERDRMANELSTATAIQENMLIRNFPAFPNHNEFDIYATMTPAKEVGGDFYDMFMINDKHLAIVIADVSDKGVPAALFMAMTKSLIKYHLPVGKPAQVLASVSRYLSEGNDKFMFVTCFVGVLNLETGEFVYANAGHNPPLIKNGKDGEYEYLNVKKNAVLGIFPKVKFEDESITLSHGSKILLYTDGVTEAIDKNNEQYQEERLLNCVKAHDNDKVSEVLPAIMKDIENFRGEQAQFDDITTLMVEYF